jgi:uncharacterized protein YndB with AHSA1/START domain
MESTKVVEWVDIKAPQADVYDIITNAERRTQLSPLYGTILLGEVSADYPAEGSHFFLKLREKEDYQYESVVTSTVPLTKLAYELCVYRETKVTWLVQDVTEGTRIIYEEEFLTETGKDDEYIASVRDAVREWLKNIKFYAELRDGRFQRFIKWIMDRFFLKFRTDQRKVILMLLFLQIVSFISFVMAALALGIARFFN